MSALDTAAGAEFPALDSLDALRDDWIDDPALTETLRATLREIPAAIVQEALTDRARQEADRYYPLLDNVRSAATRQLLRHLGIDPDN